MLPYEAKILHRQSGLLLRLIQDFLLFFRWFAVLFMPLVCADDK